MKHLSCNLEKYFHENILSVFRRLEFDRSPDVHTELVTACSSLFWHSSMDKKTRSILIQFILYFYNSALPTVRRRCLDTLHDIGMKSMKNTTIGNPKMQRRRLLLQVFVQH